MKYRVIRKKLFLKDKAILKIKLSALLFIICFGFHNHLAAQSMPCVGHLNVSLDGDCEYQVDPSTVITAANVVDSEYSVSLEDSKGTALTDNILRFGQLGQTVTVKVMDNSSSNSCWGTILVEDKKAPNITCGSVDVICLDMDAYLPTVTDNCDPNVQAIQIGGTTTLSDCDPDNNILKIISRTYVAEDSNGLRSEACTHTINVLRIDTDNIIPPVDLIDGLSFECNSTYPVDANGNPHPDTTGVPMLVLFDDMDNPVDTIPLWPEINDQCKARMTYDDTVIGSGTCKVKIMRRWSFYDACTSTDPYTHIQMIFIEDKEGPSIDCPASPLTLIGSPVSGLPSGVDCRLAVNIPSVLVNDNCTSIQSVGVEINDAPVLATNGGSVILEPGMHELTYVASDGCNLSQECIVDIEVTDNSPPLAICDKYSVIGLTADGTVEVDASVFDDGSFDACGIGNIHIARVGTTICDSSDFDFGPTITFCCGDIGVEVDAVVRVFDLAGAFSECDVKIEIQDKTPSNGICPADQTIDCDFPLDINDLSKFGEAVATNVCGSGIQETDPIIDLGSCNNGTIIRRWTDVATGSEIVCSQTITVSNPFSFDNGNIDQLIIKPRNIDTTGACGLSLDPENLPLDAQRPTLLESNSCDLIGTTYKDETFTFDDGSNACFKIVRTWTILNWCAPADNNTIVWAQIIKVTDTEAPTVSLDATNQNMYCVTDNNCENGTVILGATGTDSCTENLTAQVLVDLNNDGTIDDDNTAISLTQTDAGTRVTLEYNYPLGTHRVQFSFRDACGLITTEDFVFNIENCKAPTCVLNNLNINIAEMPQGIMACIWASDFEASSTSNCPGSDLSYFFDASFSMPDSCFTCTNLGAQSVDIFVVDGFGNSALCSPMLTITDHDALCTQNIVGTQETQIISGLISNHNGGVVPDAKVSLSNTEYPVSMSSDVGSYAFDNISVSKDYMVEVEKNDDFLNGVSTLDLVLIQKHILGLDMLEGPYNMIAADINNSGNISAIDLVELRKIILGEQSSFTSNTSWRFIDKNYEFINDSNPFNEVFPEEYEIFNLDRDMTVDFIGVKVGDVTGNATFNELNSSQVRSNKNLKLSTTSKIDEGSNILIMEISSENFQSILGFQTTLAFTSKSLEYIGVEGGALDMTSNNIGKRFSEDGLLALSWSSPEEINSGSNEVLFNLIFRVKDSNYQNLKISNEITSTEVYFGNETSNNILIDDKQTKLLLEQNVPNPWFDKTEIAFSKSEKGNVNLVVYDLFGKQIYNKSLEAVIGMNRISIDRTDIPNSGIYLYELSDGNQKLINKMIVID